MRLRITGAVVRAACAARFTATHRTIAPPAVFVVGQRFTSSRAAAYGDSKSFLDQSVTSEREVDPRKLAIGQEPAQDNEPLDDGLDVAEFKRAIQNGSQTGKIIKKGGHQGVKISTQAHIFDATTNVTSTILDLVGRDVYNKPNHPICITRKLIESVFTSPEFKHHIASDPAVTIYDNFDVLGFPEDHPGRSRTDTYYLNSTHVLRTHTSAHQDAAFKHMSRGSENGFTICADVYRRDSIDRSHFPVFHQMEGARMWSLSSSNPQERFRNQQDRTHDIKTSLRELPTHNLVVSDEVGSYDTKRNPVQSEHDPEDVELTVAHLKRSLELLVDKVFTAAKAAGVGSEAEKDEPLKVRWIEAYFPFTSPSFELEVFWQGDWLELLGCGITQQPILNNAGLRTSIGWAWGIGIERLAMLLFGVPDIRLFWSEDPRFLNQFEEGKVTKFKPFSKYPPCPKDVSFWIYPAPAAASPIGAGSGIGVAAAAGGDATKASPAEAYPNAFHENDMMEIVRDVAGPLVEDVKLIEEFTHPSTGRKSLLYRMVYRSLEKTLTNQEVNSMHDEITARIAAELDVELR